MPIPTYNSNQDQTNPAAAGTAGQASLETLSSTNTDGRVLGTGSGGTVSAPGYTSGENHRHLSKEEADRLYEERMEE
ncbi:hypothetical protein BBP40_012497, partial [Aspergillus hancockii]